MIGDIITMLIAIKLVNCMLVLLTSAFLLLLLLLCIYMFKSFKFPFEYFSDLVNPLCVCLHSFPPSEV